ncbi:MAG: NAD(P)/FAD-dependent oxidoreductase [Fimbriimonadaceae bacterium]
MAEFETFNTNVAVIGGGPGGSTLAALIKKYAPEIAVTVFERETFPRDHVGESQLPLISAILHEMGCWDKVEAADFPIKIGATYRWGKTDDLWDFEFYPAKEFVNEPRPAKFVGQRRQTAFQVDRAKYDQILLDHARSLGAEVHEGIAVKSISTDGDRVDSLELTDGRRVVADWYVDASGNAAILRRALNVPVTQPETLKNVAFWDYWQNAEWAVEIGVGATRVQVMSLQYGWIWFIPLGPTRTSIGLVIPASYHKRSGQSMEELYLGAIAKEPRIAAWTKNATREGPVRGTKDWSFVAEQLSGPNWLLVGEAAGFADPILAAGLTLTHASAREAAYSIIACHRGDQDGSWLLQAYSETQKSRIWQHIRFADYWYTANDHFDNLKEFTRDIARDAGLELDAQSAFQWLGTGGFADDGFGASGVASFSLFAIKKMREFVGGAEFAIEPTKYASIKLNLSGANRYDVPIFRDGKVDRLSCLERSRKRLPLTPAVRAVIDVLKQEEKSERVIERLRRSARTASPADPEWEFINLLETLDALMLDGWATGRKKLAVPLDVPELRSRDALIHANVDNASVENL